MPISLRSTRTMMKAFNQDKPAHTFLLNTFFPNVDTKVTEKVDVDFKKGRRKMAPFVSPRKGGVVMKREGFVTKTYEIPKIAPERITTVDDINKRSMGESVYSLKTPEERAIKLIAKDLKELDTSITRREEWMCRSLMLDGKIIMKGEGVEQEIDFELTQKETLAGEDSWSNPETCTPIDDLKSIRKKIIKATGKAPSVVIMSSKAADKFIMSKQVKEYFDKRFIVLGKIEPSIRNEAVTFLGEIHALGLELYSYDEWFINDEGIEEPIMPDDSVIVSQKGANKIIYGAVTQIEDNDFVTFEGRRIPKNWVDGENEIKKLRITSRPLPCPEDVDSWFRLNI
jgi:hypothetical protein